MTRPIFEPTLPRTLSAQGYTNRQLLRRPGQRNLLQLWSWLAWYDGMTIPMGDWDFPTFWEDCFLSDDAVTTGYLYPDPENDSFSTWFGSPNGAMWVSDVRAVWGDDGPSPSSTGFIGISNLIEIGGSLGNTNITNFEPALLTITEASNNAFNCPMPFAVEDAQPDRFLTAEFGAFTSVDMAIFQVEMHVWRAADGDATYQAPP